ncbi:hypothetical protein FRC12_019207 [Ceratobasidium sp. 428]|nr:hypothetical protein FRC12_019207 [Ceratobasidium sp. 428]
MLETAHSDLVRMSHEVSPLETVGEVKFSDFLDTVREIGERRRNAESLILKVMKTLDEAWSHYPRMAFVNALPPEILSLIFKFVVLSEFTDFSVSGREAKEKSGSKLTRPEYPATLSKVCNLWHRVVTSTPILWSYINLVVSGSKRDVFYLRASRSIKLAAGVPLSIRIHQHVGRPKPYTIRYLTRWLAPIAERIYSLEVAKNSSRALLNSVLCCWFKHGVPGTVKELSLWCLRNNSRKFIQPASSGPRPWRINVSPTKFEAFFQPITTLYLDGVFARWNSQAYRGLTHLQLSDGSIKEDQLMSILSNNPQLRSFTYNLWMKHNKPRKTPPNPVQLPNLETLNLSSLENSDLWSILRLLAPGPKPLTLSLATGVTDSSYDYVETPEAQAFFQRSNITTCHLGTYGEPRETWFPKILRGLPNLRRLCLRGHPYLDIECLTTSDEMRVCSQLSELIMIGYKLDLDEFKDLLSAHHIQVLRLWNCSVFRQGNGLDMSAGELEEELSEFVANTRYYSRNDDVSLDPHMSRIPTTV